MLVFKTFVSWPHYFIIRTPFICNKVLQYLSCDMREDRSLGFPTRSDTEAKICLSPDAAHLTGVQVIV